ncbi:MAG: holin-associated N-acetylmuramidase [Paracoccaceae bacterium]
MPTVDQIADEIVAREGGFVNDPDDPGGPTNMGVTLTTLQRVGADLTGDGKVTVADLRRLTRKQASDIFVQDYYRRPGIDRLPEAIRASVFDMYVNAGANAVKILQRLLCDMGFEVVDDGVIGPLTEAAAAHAAEVAPGHLADAYAIARRNYYYRLADGRPQSRKYARARDGGKGGWILRAETFMSPRYRLTEAEHRARVASWG